jgi:riboflavin kinase / FMN adenylyltransferase
MRTAVAIGVFDGVHLGHRRVLEALRAAGTPRVVTFDPHPVEGTQLICSLERRVELLREAGVADVVVAAPGDVPDSSGARLVAGPGATASPRPPDVHVPLVEGVSSELVRRLVATHELEHAARLLGRPFELEGVVVEGERRGRLLGFPTANLRVDPALLVPANGIYAGAALGRRAAISIGLNPHYGGSVRSVEAYLLDFDGDLYGRRLRVELWSFLRAEAAFSSERELVAQIARDVEEARAAIRPGRA